MAVRYHPYRYFSLMSLICNYLVISGFGLCCGMGSCGSCLVEIDGYRTLSCAIAVNDDLVGAKIKVVNSEMQ